MTAKINYDQLPQITIGDETYLADERNNEILNLNNPEDSIRFELEGMINALVGALQQPAKVKIDEPGRLRIFRIGDKLYYEDRRMCAYRDFEYPWSWDVFSFKEYERKLIEAYKRSPKEYDKLKRQEVFHAPEDRAIDLQSHLTAIKKRQQMLRERQRRLKEISQIKPKRRKKER